MWQGLGQARNITKRKTCPLPGLADSRTVRVHSCCRGYETTLSLHSQGNILRDYGWHARGHATSCDCIWTREHIFQCLLSMARLPSQILTCVLMVVFFLSLAIPGRSWICLILSFRTRHLILGTEAWLMTWRQRRASQGTRAQARGQPIGGRFLQHHKPPGFQGDPPWEGP